MNKALDERDDLYNILDEVKEKLLRGDPSDRGRFLYLFKDELGENEE